MSAKMLTRMRNGLRNNVSKNANKFSHEAGGGGLVLQFRGDRAVVRRGRPARDLCQEGLHLREKLLPKVVRGRPVQNGVGGRLEMIEIMHAFTSLAPELQNQSAR